MSDVNIVILVLLQMGLVGLEVDLEAWVEGSEAWVEGSEALESWVQVSDCTNRC